MRKWRIELQFENRGIHFSTFTLKDVTAFIKESRNCMNNKNSEVEKYKTLPVDKWIVAMVFDRAERVYPNTELVAAVITEED